MAGGCPSCQIDWLGAPPLGAVSLLALNAAVPWDISLRGGMWKLTADLSALRLSGGASELIFDAQRFGAVGGRTVLASGGFADAVNRYEIRFTGGASQIDRGHCLRDRQERTRRRGGALRAPPPSSSGSCQATAVRRRRRARYSSAG